MKDTGETKVLGPGWPVAGQVHGAGMNTDTSGRGPGEPGVGLVAAKVGSNDMIKIMCWGDRLGRTTEEKESGVGQKSLRTVQRLGVGVCPRERSIDELRKKCPEGHVRWKAKRGMVSVLAEAWGADVDTARS